MSRARPYLRLTKLVFFTLPLFALPACNHHTGMPLPRADAGPDAGQVLDLGKGVDETTDVPAPDTPFEDLAISAVDVATLPIDAAALDDLSPARLTVNPTSVDLPVTFVGDVPRAAQPATFTVQNSGGTASGVLQIALTGPNASYFKIVNDTCSGVALAVRGSCTVGAVWAPIGMGSPSTASLVASDSASGQSVTATLGGTTLLGDCLLVSPTQADLGSVLPGVVGTEVRVTVTNFCDFDLGTVGTQLFGQSAGNVRVSTNACANTLAPKGICVTGLQLAPPSDAEPATQSATLTVYASGGGIYQVAITGTVLAKPNPGTDASVDAVQDANAFLFPELPGHTLVIAAGNTPPDASAGLGVACKSPSQDAAYSLTFSADGTKVHLVRTDPVQEAMLDGTLVSQTDTRLRYTINTGLGGALMVWKAGGTLIAQFELYGSGLPVVQCIQSPMTGV